MIRYRLLFMGLSLSFLLGACAQQGSSPPSSNSGKPVPLPSDCKVIVDPNASPKELVVIFNRLRSECHLTDEQAERMIDSL